jgi:putative SOS response-associated peptidase YedK
VLFKGEDMCGRYASARKRIELLEEFRVERDRVSEPLAPDYNVAPTKRVYAVLTRGPRGAAGRDEDAGSSDGRAGDKRAADGQAGDEQAAAGQAGDRRAAGQAGDRRAAGQAGDRRAAGQAADMRAAAGQADDGDAAGEARELRVVRWGLVPFWAKDPSIGSRMINARAETVSVKPAFRRAFARRRCLLPADGYYEWYRPGGDAKAAKQPYYIYRADGAPLAFAGLYELWRNPEFPDDHPDAWLWTSTIITTSAPDELGRIHDRMPMVIGPELWADWLDPGNNDTGDLMGLLAPAGASGLISRRVSTAVNSVRNNGPRLIEPAEPEPGAAAPGSAGLPGPPEAPLARSRAVRSSAPPETNGSGPDTLF